MTKDLLFVIFSLASRRLKRGVLADTDAVSIIWGGMCRVPNVAFREVILRGRLQG